PHVSIGIVSGREAVRLARVLPLNIAMRVALMGKHERMDAQRAYDLGLVSEVVPHDHLMERAWEIADIVNRNAPLAVRGTRTAARRPGRGTFGACVRRWPIGVGAGSRIVRRIHRIS
ncbi:MAG: hypothetical protein IIC51_11635, partial [Planctomycetes bacterium]|nr:hypothetical protein [Planctomycetota bacterium]